MITLLLQEYVRESNAIENIHVGPNHPLFTDHMEAAKLVAESVFSSEVVYPRDIHRVLMRSQLPDAGSFRKVKVWVGLDQKPRPEDTDRLMERWMGALYMDLSCPPKDQDKKEDLAWHYHHWFEAIHPFVDGNGRTGRLILNNIRLLLGLPWPWLIIYSADRAGYYESIRRWEAANKELFS